MNTLLGEVEHLSAERTSVVLPRFGECTYGEAEVIRFPWGLPGFAALHRFLVISVDEEEAYIWLQSLDDPNVAIPICDPWSIFDDYDVVLPSYAKQSLAIERPDGFCVMCVLVARPGSAAPTINLLAPIVINLETRIGRQVTLENQRYSVRTPVPQRSSESKEVAPS